MTAIVVLLIFLLGFGLGILVAWIRPKPAVDKRDQRDLVRLREMENKLTTLCMQNSTDSFAYIVLDEIVTSRNRTPIEGRKDT